MLKFLENNQVVIYVALLALIGLLLVQIADQLEALVSKTSQIHSAQFQKIKLIEVAKLNRVSPESKPEKHSEVKNDE